MIVIDATTIYSTVINTKGLQQHQYERTGTLIQRKVYKEKIFLLLQVEKLTFVEFDQHYAHLLA